MVTPTPVDFFAAVKARSLHKLDVYGKYLRSLPNKLGRLVGPRRPGRHIWPIRTATPARSEAGATGAGRTMQDDRNANYEKGRSMSIQVKEVIKPGATLELGYSGPIQFHSAVTVESVTEAEWGLLVGLEGHGELCIDNEHLSSIDQDVTASLGGRPDVYRLFVGEARVFIEPESIATTA